ncbi:PEP-CTERM sorting domain-containing protein [Marinobacter sp.]|uniref:PEP-CTERM sorting domain-containing protein n=1 Tax=Marinobacter sp. TaxID=50741 RepID=UPI002B265C4C|nr:PEP-CTERM sorting domain-containing protein [Marinobacter sp.]
MKHTIKSLILLLALGFMSPANAALITYAYNDKISNQFESYDAAALFTVDDQRSGLVSAVFTSTPISFSWSGFVPLMYAQPVSNVGRLYENGFEPFDVGDYECFLFLDLFWLEAGENIFHNLHKTAPFEGAHVANLTTETGYSFTGRLTKLTTTQVPEPTPLALFGLGLLGLAARHSRELRKKTLAAFA